MRRVVLADDHRLFRDGIRSLLEASGKVQVVGEAANGREAVVLTRRLGPDVVLMDLAMPELNGIEATRQICQERPQTRVIVLSMHGHRQYLFEAFRAGASGYLLKGAAFAELLEAIDAVNSGRTFLSRDLAGTALEDYILRAQKGGDAGDLDKLSSREREILQLIAEGRSSPEIAKRLHISVRTVESHRRNLMDKLGIHSIAELTKFAIRHGLSSLE